MLGKHARAVVGSAAGGSIGLRDPRPTPGARRRSHARAERFGGALAVGAHAVERERARTHRAARRRAVGREPAQGGGEDDSGLRLAATAAVWGADERPPPPPARAG